MNARGTIIISLLVILAGLGHITNALADESATIVNNSKKNVEFFLYWSELPRESGKIVLAPGESRTTNGPDGAVLKMRFNSTPGQLPPRERVVQVITANVNDPHHPGYISYFRDLNKFIVGIYDH